MQSSQLYYRPEIWFSLTRTNFGQAGPVLVANNGPVGPILVNQGPIFDPDKFFHYRYSPKYIYYELLALYNIILHNN